MIDKDVTIERLGFVRELLRIGGFNSKIKANHVKTIDDAIALLKEHEQAMKEKDGTISTMIAQIKEISQYYERVVRCKDCKYGQPINGEIWCHKYTPRTMIPPEWFCADGRRKEQLLEFADKDTAYYANQEVLRPLI